MPNSKLCETAVRAGRAGPPDQSMLRMMQKTGQNIKSFKRIAADSSTQERSKASPGVEKTAEEFASVFYSLLFKSLQTTVPRGQEGALSAGTRGLVDRYLPRAMAKSGSGSLTRYIEKHIEQGQEGSIDERI